MTTRYRLISTGRGGELRRLLQSLTTDAAHLPRASELRAALEEIFPDGDHVDYAPVREALYVKAGEIAKAAQNKQDRFRVRGEIDSLVEKTIEGADKLDRLVPIPEPEEPVDLDEIATAASYRDSVAPDLDRRDDEERREAEALRRKMGIR